MLILASLAPRNRTTGTSEVDPGMMMMFFPPFWKKQSPTWARAGGLVMRASADTVPISPARIREETMEPPFFLGGPPVVRQASLL